MNQENTEWEQLEILSAAVWPGKLGSMSNKTFEWTRVNEPKVFENALNWLEGCTGFYKMFAEYSRLFHKLNNVD